MAITIVSKPGSIFPLRLTCGHCQAVLEAGTVQDVDHEEDGPMYNMYTVYGVKCPVCGHFVKASEAKQEALRREWQIAKRR